MIYQQQERSSFLTTATRNQSDLSLEYPVDYRWIYFEAGTLDPLAPNPKLRIQLDPNPIGGPYEIPVSELILNMRSGEVVEGRYGRPKDAEEIGKHVQPGLEWARHSFERWVRSRGGKA